MFIDLLRHGEAEGTPCFRGHTDHALSKSGHQQMMTTLQDYTADVVITSPLSRCAEFAHEWSAQQNIDCHAIDDFKEINFGDWDGLMVEQIKASQQDELNLFWHDPVNFTPPNAESLVAFQQRILTGWESLLNEHLTQDNDKNILLITHGGVIRVLIAHVLSMPLNKLLSIESPLAGMSRLRISIDEQNNRYSSLVFHAGTAS